MIKKTNKETINSAECEHNFDGGRRMLVYSAGKKGSLRRGLDAWVSGRAGGGGAWEGARIQSAPLAGRRIVNIPGCKPYSN